MRPATVWIVRPGERMGVRATMTLTEDSISLDPDTGDRLEIAARRFTEVRRERGTPVLSLAYLGDPGEERHLLLYFIPPPPLPEAGRAGFVRPRGLERTVGIFALLRANRRLKPEVRAWESALESLRSER